MNYVNYDHAIVQKHHVKLVVWPKTLNFMAPHMIYTVDGAHLLWHCLQEKTCHWVKLSKKEVAEHLATVIAREKKGLVVGQKCKIHSDKGTIRKQAITTQGTTGDDNDDNNDLDSHEDENANEPDSDENTHSKPRRSLCLKGNTAHRPLRKKSKRMAIVHDDSSEFIDSEPASGNDEYGGIED